MWMWQLFLFDNTIRQSIELFVCSLYIPHVINQQNKARAMIQEEGWFLNTAKQNKGNNS